MLGRYLLDFIEDDTAIVSALAKGLEGGLPFVVTPVAFKSKDGDVVFLTDMKFVTIRGGDGHVREFSVIIEVHRS